jgi:hypothetical protein
LAGTATFLAATIGFFYYSEDEDYYFAAFLACLTSFLVLTAVFFFG